MHTMVCQLQVDLDHLDSSDLVTHQGLISNMVKERGWTQSQGVC